MAAQSSRPARSFSFGALRLWLTLAFFFVSGGTGLLYQVVWTRRLVLLFGTTSYAVSTVLSIFFLGLGLGSLVGGRLADRTRRPLLVYGLFEVAIGLWAVGFVLFIGAGESVVVGALRGFAASRGMGIALRAGLSAAFLLAPVVLMGATLPLLSRFVAGDSQTRGFRIGALYSVNTFGAVAGCALAGFCLLPQLGYMRTTLAGAAANVLVGVLAAATGMRAGSAARPAPDAAGGEPAANPLAAGPRAAVLLGFGLSGFVALALEVVWTRLLTVIFLGTTYAFTTMLTTLLCGIAAGSAVASPLIDRRRHPVSLFGAVEILIGASCIAMLPVFAGLPERLQAMQLSAGYHWAGVVRAKFVLSFLVLFVPTFLSGMTFPIVVKAVTAQGERLGRDVGKLYAANTLGGVLGSLAGGFVIIPMLGTHRGILVLSVVAWAVGMALVFACPSRRRMAKGGLALAGAALLTLAFRAAPQDINRAITQAYIPADNRVIHYREGVEGTVAVSEPIEHPTGSDRVLWINAVQATASIEKGVKMNRFQGVLPLLFDRDPKRVLFMCFGSGITAGTLGLYDFERMDAVEIAKDVLDAAPLFEKDNFHIMKNPKMRFVVDDGRNFLLTTGERYDVITFEPMPLALAGVSTFYTKEYYRLCLDRLAPGGIVSQWVPLHSLNPDIVRALVRTFTSVFPEYNAWFVNADLFLIGSDAPLRIDYPVLARRLSAPGIRQAIEAVGFGDAIEVVSCFFMGKDNLDAYVGTGPVMCDDRPWAEFVAPKLMYERTVEDTLDEITPYFESPAGFLDMARLTTAQAEQLVRQLDRRSSAKAKDLEALRLYYGGMFGAEPEVLFKEALAIDPDDYNARYYLTEITAARAKTYLRWDEPEKAIAALEDALQYVPRHPGLLVALADIYYGQQDFERARTFYARYVEAGGASEEALARLRSLPEPPAGEGH